MGAADRALHLRIMDFSRNKVLLRLAEGYRVLSMAVRASRDPRIVHEEHLRIIEAIDHNFPDEAERLMRLHVAEARQMLEEQAAKREFTPKWVTDSQIIQTTRRPQAVVLPRGRTRNKLVSTRENSYAESLLRENPARIVGTLSYNAIHPNLS